MKAAIMTLHRFDNVGSCLQACALSQYLNSQLHSVYLIDYTPRYRQYYEPMKIAALIFNKKNISQRMTKIDSVLKDYANLTKRVYTKKKVKNLTSQFDLLIAGGDQIWNPMYPNYYDDSFYFYGIDNTPKIAYGSSVSVPELSAQQVDYLRKRISSFAAVNVREKKTAELFVKNHINDNTHFVMDPVFLPDVTLYREMSRKARITCVNESDDFILAYHLDPGNDLDNILKKIKDVTGYHIVSLIGNRKYWESDTYLQDYGPYEFLWLIRHAKYVLTGSFHCLCFSLMFKTPFLIQLPNKSPNRLLNILDSLKCNERIITKERTVDSIIGQKGNEGAYALLDDLVAESRTRLNLDIAAYKE